VVELKEPSSKLHQGNITVSSDLNKVRLSNIPNEMINELLEFITGIGIDWSLIDIFEDLTKVNMTLDFSEGKVYVEYDWMFNYTCNKVDAPKLSKISVAFLLKSYDLFTFFKSDYFSYYYVISDLRAGNYSANVTDYKTYKSVEDLPRYLRLKCSQSDMTLSEVKYKSTQIDRTFKPTVYTDVPVTEKDFIITDKQACVEISNVW
jgi:hypothetical protein